MKESRSLSSSRSPSSAGDSSRSERLRDDSAERWSSSSMQSVGSGDDDNGKCLSSSRSHSKKKKKRKYRHHHHTSKSPNLLKRKHSHRKSKKHKSKKKHKHHHGGRDEKEKRDNREPENDKERPGQGLAMADEGVGEDVVPWEEAVGTEMMEQDLVHVPNEASVNDGLFVHQQRDQMAVGVALAITQ